MGPLEVESGFDLPGAVGGAGAGGVGDGVVGAAVLIELLEGGGIGEAEGGTEDLEVVPGGGVVVGIDDGDGLVDCADPDCKGKSCAPGKVCKTTGNQTRCN